METTHYSYNGKSWRPSPTMSDYNSFFHSAFGVKTDENGYFDKLANFKRMQWITFLTYFKYETMPSCLTDTLRKCYPVNEKCKNVCSDDQQYLTLYISGLMTGQQAITKEEVAILATLENTKVVILSNGGLHAITVIEPNLNILGSYPKEVNKEKPKEVVLYLEGNVFTRLEPVREEQSPKPIKNKVQKKTDPSKYTKADSAGSKGVEYQISLIAMVMLNAMNSVLSEWKLSTENVEAGKFDDIVLEWTERAVLIQSKHKEDSKKMITLNELTSTNSKSDDFSLPKYFLSYMSIKGNFTIKNIIICTNAGVHENALEFLDQLTTNTESLLHYEDGKCSFHTLKDTILPLLEEKTILYYDQNFKNKGVQKSVITEENLTDFLIKFQLYFNYPPVKGLQEIIEKLLSSISCCSNPRGKVTPLEIYSKLMDWFKQKAGVYFTEIHAKAIFAEIWTDRYCQKLRNYELSFENNELNFPGPKQIFHITSPRGSLLQAIKVYYAVQKERILFVNHDDDTDTQKLILEAFAIPQYVFLILNQLQIMEKSVIIEMCAKLRDILGEKKYKKVILMTGNNDALSNCLLHEIDYEIINGSVTFADLTKDFQEKLLKQRSIIFQGKPICLQELLAGRTTEDYANAVDQEILDNIISGEVKVGVRPTDMDEDIAPFYITRTFKRSMGNIHEKDIYDVEEKTVLISDRAGVGKTTVLSKLAKDIKEKYPSLWVFKIALTEYTHILRDLKNGRKSISITKLLNSKNATKLTNRLESFVISMEEKIILLFDGIDEISPDYTELVHNLLTQCLQATNLAKLFVTTRPHMMQELKNILKVDPFELQPFTEQNQVHFLTGYWTHKLNVAPENKEKCEKYARALIEKMSSWTKGNYYDQEKFTAIAVQLRMVAEIFQETIKLNDISDWEGCKNYLESANGSPSLPGKIEINKLYGMFIETKRYIYIRKGNPSGNSEANTTLNTKFNESLAYHKILALEVILSKKDRQLFSCYQESSKVINESVLKMGIVQGYKERFYFIHRTFAEYFVAESLVSELQLQSQNPNVKFQEFFIDDVLTRTNYEIIRAFLDGFLQNMVDPILSNIFKSYQSQNTKYHPIDEFKRVLNILLSEGHVAILQLILKCIDFKMIKNKTYSAKDLHHQKNMKLEDLLKTIGREHIAVNTLDALKNVLQNVGFEFWDEYGTTPLMIAARGNLKMVRFLVNLGVKVNSADRGGFTALHVAVHRSHMDILKYLVQQGAEIDCRNSEDNTPLHFATVRSNLKCVKYLVKSGANVTIRDYCGRTVLHLAARGRFNKSQMSLAVRREQQAIIKYLVKCGGDINVKDEDGCTPLHFAAKYSHVDTIKLLHGLGAGLNIANNYGQMALHLAAEYGNLDGVEYLIMFNEDVDIKDDNGCTPLLLAASSGHVNVVKFLQQQNANVEMSNFICKMGADLNIGNGDNKTPLHLAAEKGHLKNIESLMKFNKDVDVRDSDGCTPLLLAASRGHTDVVKFLQHQNANFDIRDNRGKTVLHVLAENGCIQEYFIECFADINARDNNGCTALHLAAEKGRMDAVNVLQKMGADLNAGNDDDETPLHLAANAGECGTVEVLHKLGAHLNIRDGSGDTALHSAAFYDNLNVVKYLLEAGADLTITDECGKTPLHSSATYGCLNVVEYLLAKGADLNITDERGKTALHSAAAAGCFNVVKYLLEVRADLNITDGRGKTALHLAAACGNLEVIKSLLEAGAVFDITDERGKTALHSAAAYGYFNVVKSLLEAGADLTITDERGKTALHLAAACGNLDVIKSLLEAGADLNVTDDRGKMALHSAATAGHLDAVKHLLEVGASLNITDDYDGMVLHLAVACGNLDVVKSLLEAGANLSIIDDHGRKVLHLAAAAGHLDVVKYLLELGADLNFTDKCGRTALHSAAAAGHLSIVKYLLVEGADLHITNDRGRTVLHLAAEYGHMDNVKYLIKFNKDVDIKDNDGCTPLLLAASRGHIDVVEFLQQQNANVEIRDNFGNTLLHVSAENGCIHEYFVKCVTDVNARDNNGCTALHLAAEKNHLDAVNLLCKMGADLNVGNGDNKTPLHLAAENCKWKMVEALYKLGAHLNIKDSSGRTALYSAAVFRYWYIVEYLLEKGADLNITDNCGRTALHSAASHGHYDAVKELLQVGADSNITDECGRTALHLAASDGYYDAVKELLQAGADLNITDKYGRTALHLAAFDGYYDVVKDFLQAGADLNIKDKCGRTALHLAASDGYYEVVENLLQAGADLNITDKCGRTALHLAASDGHLDVVKCLLQAGADVTIKDMDGLTPTQLASHHRNCRLL